MREWGGVQAYLKRECPSPITRAAIAIQQAKNQGNPLDASSVDALYDRAERAALAWPPRLGSAEWFDALGMVDGGDARLLFEVVSRTHPAFTPAQADELAPKVTGDEWSDLVRVSLYGTHPRPKGDAATMPPQPASPSETIGVE